MAIGIGLDTGGTYTDGVIYHLGEKKILQKAKALTIKEDLTIGINQVLDQFEARLLAETELVALSTTLATNACVEGKGGRARLILIGCDRRVIERYGHETGLPPASEMIFLDGGHDQSGRLAKIPDWASLRQAILDQNDGAEAYAVVELWGVRNPDLENQARALLAEWTGRPVVCGHEITGELNSLKRAASALLNAQLLPLIRDFLDAVKTSLKQRQIQAPLLIVRGDGSLMAEDFARKHPVETLLCGPAASVAGGLALTGESDCLIVDMGGTTSDLAMVRNGQPALATGGARIGNWQTGVHSILIHTVGLGGDSLIRHGRDEKLRIGPRRAAPLSWAASQWPEIIPVLHQILAEERRHTHSLAQFFYATGRKTSLPSLSKTESAILKALADGPLSIMQLAGHSGSSIYNLETERLEKLGLIMRCGLTPTDIMHLNGTFTAWNQEAAAIAADIMAFQLNISRRQLIDQVEYQVREAIYLTILTMLFEQEYADASGRLDRSSQVLALARQQFADIQAKKQPDNLLNYALTLSKPLVGIGAPTHLYLPDVAAALATECRIPPYAEVANAVGAITGHVVAVERALIKPDYSPAGIRGYFCYTPSGNQYAQSYEQALAWAREHVGSAARQAARARGASQPQIDIAVNRLEAPYSRQDATEPLDSEPYTAAEEEQLFLETMIEARATGACLPGIARRLY